METFIIILILLLILSLINRPITYKFVYVIYYKEPKNNDWKRWPGTYNNKNECNKLIYKWVSEYSNYEFICVKEII